MYRVAVCALAIVIAVVAAEAAGAGSAAIRCNLWVSPNGEDTDPGSQSHPLRTLTRLASSLAPGQVGCLAPGSTFANREVITAVGSAKGRITITTAPGGARAVLGDGIETTQASRYLTLTNLTIEGTSNVTARAGDSDRARLLDGVDALGGRPGHPEGDRPLVRGPRPCRHLARVRQHPARVQRQLTRPVRRRGSRRHLCGARIFDNVIFGNAGGDGIAFSPNAQTSLARGNLVIANLGGIYFGGDAGRHRATIASRRT